MITYFYDDNSKNVTSILYDENYLTDEDKQNPHKIQLEKEYVVPFKEDNSYELFVENGEIKHRYIPIVLTENEKIKALEVENASLKEKLKKQENEITINQEAITQIYELMASGGVASETDM